MGSWLEWVWVPLAVAVGGGVVVGVALLVIEYRTGWFARRGSSERGGAEVGGRAVEGEEAGGGRRMGKRKRIPEKTVAELLVRSRRRCCLCFGLDGDLSEKEGQIAHLDGDPSNNDMENLAWLCLEHHNRYDSQTSQSKGLTIGEVKEYRDELYRALEAGGPGGDRAWGVAEARAAGVHAPGDTQAPWPPTAAASYLPPKPYHRLVGRVNELDRIMSALREPERKPMIGVVGLGGIGKTALAREAVELCRQEGLFDWTVWTSYKTEYFVAEEIAPGGAADYSFDELLSDVGRQCGRVDIAQMPAEQKRAAVRYLLATKRVLVVMDNVESVPGSEKLVGDVFEILGRSKLLITSRPGVKHERVLTVKLGGFPEDEGVTFVREEGRERGIGVVAEAGRQSLVEIHQVTGGAPLAMKLVVGQMSRQPMEVVLGALKQASFGGADYPFYRFVYQRSWEMLDLNGRMVLVDMSVFPASTGGAVDDVQAVSQVKPSALWLAMDQLVTLSLVDKVGPAGGEWFALHPLTQYFVRSDITKEWAQR